MALKQVTNRPTLYLFIYLFIFSLEEGSWTSRENTGGILGMLGGGAAANVIGKDKKTKSPLKMCDLDVGMAEKFTLIFT